MAVERRKTKVKKNLVLAFCCFPTMFSKDLHQVCYRLELCGKGLNIDIIFKIAIVFLKFFKNLFHDHDKYLKI